jgi:transcriptional regulator with XRE-family HTH domain
MSKLKAEFGKRVKYLRERKGMTQEKLAESIGRSHSTVSKIEQGVHGPRFLIFERIVTALDSHPREFFDFDWEESNEATYT